MRELKNNTFRYVHEVFIFITIVFFIVPVATQLFINFSVDMLVFRAGYGLIFLGMYYLLTWIFVPLFVFLFRWSDKTLWSKSSIVVLTFILLAIAFLTIKLNDEVIFDKEDVAQYSFFCAVTVFLWFMYVKKEY